MQFVWLPVLMCTTFSGVSVGAGECLGRPSRCPRNQRSATAHHHGAHARTPPQRGAGDAPPPAVVGQTPHHAPPHSRSHSHLALPRTPIRPLSPHSRTHQAQTSKGAARGGAAVPSTPTPMARPSSARPRLESAGSSSGNNDVTTAAAARVPADELDDDEYIEIDDDDWDDDELSGIGR